MSRGRNRRISFPEPGDERPSALSADGLTVGPLLGEDGEDMGTYHFAGPLSDAPPGLVLPLVAGFARGVSPGGRWRRRASAIKVAGDLRAFVREIVKLYPGLEAIEDLRPEMYRAWFLEVRSGAVWPGRIVIVRGLLEETDGVRRETLQTVRTLKASKPDRGASKPYTPPGSFPWHPKVQLDTDDGAPPKVTFQRLRKTWLGMHRRPNQNAREDLESS